MSQGDPTFSEFYAGYLAHHRHPWNRALHLAAKLLALAGLATAVYERSVLLLLAVPVLAVAPCWIGHLLFEGDRPVSWTQPAASLLGTLARICGLGGSGHPDPAPPHEALPPRPPAVRPYYSFAADLRMCGAMLLAALAKRAPPTPAAMPATPSAPAIPAMSAAPAMPVTPAGTVEAGAASEPT